MKNAESHGNFEQKSKFQTFENIIILENGESLEILNKIQI